MEKIKWKTSLDNDFCITSINVDSFKNEVTIIREIGIDVKAIVISIEKAMDIGFINLEMLCNYM